MSIVAERTLTMTALICSPCVPLPSPDRYYRINRNAPVSPSAKTRPRRSLSTDSYGREESKGKELSAGQKKAAEDKKGSRHADVIDTWDPTGLGSASESILLFVSLNSSTNQG